MTNSEASSQPATSQLDMVTVQPGIDPRAQEVLEYWFQTSEPPFQQNTETWFMGGPTVDQEIQTRFAPLIQDAVAGELDHWTDTPLGRLALVILLDQFTRNAFRGTPAAFAGDERAQRIVLEAIQDDIEPGMDPYARMFFHVVLEHAEDRNLQTLAIDRARLLVQDVPEDQEDTFWDFLGYVEDHAGIIHRFGRFPDRNHILGRASTPQEKQFLATEHRAWFEIRPKNNQED